MVWLAFLVAALAIFVAGSALARNGAIIGERTGLGHVWVGALLIATATSLPEIATGSAAILRDAPGLAAGGVFGSNMANMALLAVIALVYGRARVIQREALGIALTASIAIALTAIAVLFIVTRLEQSIAGAFGFGTVVLFVAVLGSLLLVSQHGEIVGEPGPATVEGAGRLPSLLRAGATFAAATGVILIAAPILAWTAEEIAEITGLAETFIGVLGLAIATSLPELATSVAAVRMGALDLAVSNIYGSNAINISILIWLDVLYTKAPLLETIDTSNAVAGLVAVLLMMIGLTGMMLRTEQRRFRVDPAATLILAAYLLGLLLVWSVSAR